MFNFRTQTVTDGVSLGHKIKAHDRFPGVADIRQQGTISRPHSPRDERFHASQNQAGVERCSALKQTQ